MRAMRSRLSVLSAIVPILALMAVSGCPISDVIPDGGGGTDTGRQLSSAPTVVLTADVVRGIAPLTVRFDSAGSTDDGLIVSRNWDFGDDQTSMDISPSHTYTTTGDFTVTLTLTDDDDRTASSSITISVTEAPIPVIDVDRTAAESAPATFNFDASASTDPDGSITSYLWNFGDGSRESLAVVPHTYGSAGTYRVRLTVTDNTGVTASSDQMIEVGIPQPEIAFRVPPTQVENIVASPTSPLWVAVTYEVEPGVPRMITAGLDRDQDPCDAQVVIYDALTEAVVHRLLGADEPVRAVAVSPNGTQVTSGGADGTLRSYNSVTGGLSRSVDLAGTPTITSVAYSAAGTRFVAGSSDGAVVLYNSATGAVVREFAGHGAQVNAVAFSPDDARLASASEDATVIVWDVASGGALAVLDVTDGGHDAPVNAVAFSPSDLDVLATGGDDNAALLWRLSTQTVTRTFGPRFAGGGQVSGHTSVVTSLGFSPDGDDLVTGSADGTAKLWDASNAGGATETQTFSGHSNGVTSVAYAPGTREVLTGSTDGTARVWDIDSGAAVQTLTPCESAVSSVAYSADGLRIVLGVAAENSVQLDTMPSGGDDLNLSVPAPLDLSELTAAADRGTYYLWVELDTDRTAPVRTYSDTVVNVVAPFTTTIGAGTPIAPLVDNKAVIVAAPTTARQIFELGTPLSRGDQLILSLSPMPGFGESYDATGFSIMVLDENEEVFVWYQDGVPFTADDTLIIGAEDEMSYYVVIDGCPRTVCGSDFLAQSISVQVMDAVYQPRRQRIFLNFDGNDLLSVGPLGLVEVPEFDAGDLKGGWADAETAAIKAEIQAQLERVFADLDVEIYTSVPTPPYMSIYFGGSATTFGAAAYIDPRNQTLSGTALVATTAIADRYDTFTAEEMGTAFGNVAGQLAGYLLGMWATEGGVTDIMDPAFLFDSAQIRSTDGVRFRRSALLWEAPEYNGPIGIQDAPQQLEELIGGS